MINGDLMKKNLLTILTPTYNRSDDLVKLYESLLSQTSKDFQWLIIDDGSQDNTRDIVQQFKNPYFPVVYKYKQNGGKHTAHNYGVKIISTELTMIVDSDDWLTENAVYSIYNEWKTVADKDLAGMSFLKADSRGEISGLKFNEDKFIGNFIKERINKNDISEKAEIWRTDILKKYLFPVFENETYVGEGAIWSEIGKKYNMLFINEVIYIYEYQTDGLTKSGRQLRINNPLGGMFAAKVTFSDEFKWFVKIKKMLLFISYGYFAKLPLITVYKESIIKWLFVLLLPFGYLLYKYWELKYMK